MSSEIERGPRNPDSLPARTRSPLLSVIVPCFNEEEVMRESHRQLSLTLERLEMRYEIIFVDDGSIDSTLEILKKIQSSDHTFAL